MSYIAYLGTNSVRGSRGIYTLRLEDNGALTLLGTTPARDSGYLCLNSAGTHLYAAVESMVLDGKAAGGIADYRVGPNSLPQFQKRYPAAGQLTCHVSCDDRYVYASSYLAGLVTVYPLTEDGTLLPACHVIRHSRTDGADPHIHCAKPTEDGRFLCVVEVGYHAVCLYDLQTFQKVCELRTPPVRPRQVVCCKDRIYCITEGGKTVLVLRYAPDEEQKLSLLQTESILPPELEGQGASGGIRRYGETLFCAVRGADRISVLRINGEDGLVRRTGCFPAGGDCPRDFNVSPDGRWLLVGLQKADRMSVLAVDPKTGSLTPTEFFLPVPSCSCVEFSLSKGGHAQ